MIFLEIFFIVIILFLLVYFLPSTIKAAIIGSPFLPTPKSIIRKALKAANLKPNEKLYDLGSGTGRVLVIGAKEFGARITGFEYSVPLFFLSKINLFIHKIKNGTIYQEDFFKADFKNADVIFMFLTPKAFKKLGNRFNQELRAGTRIITYSSPLLFWRPEKIIPLLRKKRKTNLYLYIKK